MTIVQNCRDMMKQESDITISTSLFESNRLAIGLFAISATWLVFSLILNVSTLVNFGYIFGIFSMVFPFSVCMVIFGTKLHVEFFGKDKYCTYFTLFNTSPRNLKCGVFESKTLNYELNEHEKLFELTVQDKELGNVVVSSLLPKKRTVPEIINIPFSRFNSDNT